MITTRGRTRRGLIVFASTFGSMAQLARGLWQIFPESRLPRLARLAQQYRDSKPRSFRPFPVGEMASRVCAYCYNTGESSPGTPCAYCAVVHK